MHVFCFFIFRPFFRGVSWPHLLLRADAHTSNCYAVLAASFITDSYYNYNHLTASFPRQPGQASTRKVKPIWILLEQETVSSSGISWAICKSAPRCRQITMPVPHHSVFYRPDALPAAQPTASKHWRHSSQTAKVAINRCWLYFCTDHFWDVLLGFLFRVICGRWELQPLKWPTANHVSRVFLFIIIYTELFLFYLRFQ